MLPEVHKALRLYRMMPVTTSTTKKSFFSLKHLLTHLRAKLIEKHLNNCILLHVHKEITDDLDLVQVARNFIDFNNEHKKYFGSFTQ